MPKEIWKPFIKDGCENKYELSNLGNFRNKETGKLIKGCIRSGYYSYNYTDDSGKSKMFKVHRMVAKLFVENDEPEKKICVNHINGDKLDNRASNLEWCTYSSNNEHAIKTGLNPKTEKAVICYDPTTELIKIYPSILEASKDTGIDDGSICNVLAGKRNTAGGFEWCYVEDNVNNDPDADLSEYKQIDGFPGYVLNADGKIYSLQYKKFLKYQNHPEGTKQVQLVNVTQQKTFLIHRLVGSYFLKKKNPDDNHIRHKDGNKTNNCVSNLEWAYVPGIKDELPSKYNIPYYNPETAIEIPKRKSANSGPKDLLTAKPKNLSKKQREERKKLLEQNSGSKTDKKKVSKEKKNC